MQDGGVEVVEMHFVFDCGNTVLIGSAVAHSAFDSAAGHPETESTGIVVTSVGSLDMGGTAELAAPDDKSFLEHAPLG